MKYIWVLLACLNVIIFILQMNYGDSESVPAYGSASEESGDMPSFINQRIIMKGQCQNFGPFAQEFVAQTIIDQEGSDGLTLTLVTEPEFTMIVHRVYVGPASLEDIERLKDQLSSIYKDAFVIVDEENKQGILSIGTFGFINTAYQIRSNLRDNGFEADINNERLKRKSRYWIQVLGEIEDEKLKKIREKARISGELVVNSAVCI